MGAVEIVPDPTIEIDPMSLSPTALALAVAGADVLILCLSLIGALADRAFVIRAADLVTESANKLREQNLLLETALNNMSLGLCMFDSQARLVICNRRYIHMYDLSPDIVKPGCSLRDLLDHRTKLGSFSADPEQYSNDLRKAIALGRTTKTMVRSNNGHVVAVLMSRCRAAAGLLRTRTSASSHAPKTSCAGRARSSTT